MKMAYALLITHGTTFGINASVALDGGHALPVVISTVGYAGAMWLFWLTRESVNARLYP